MTARELIDRLNKAIPEKEKDNEIYIAVHRDENSPEAMLGYNRVSSGEYSDEFRIYLDVLAEEGMYGIDVFIKDIPF